MSNCSGALDSDGWCRTCGGGHEPADEMVTRLEITRKQLRLMDTIRTQDRKRR